MSRIPSVQEDAQRYLRDVPADRRRLDKAVDDALFWLKNHPQYDYIDACYAITAPVETRTDAGSNYSTNLWPELVAAVKRQIALNSFPHPDAIRA